MLQADGQAGARRHWSVNRVVVLLLRPVHALRISIFRSCRKSKPHATAVLHVALLPPTPTRRLHNADTADAEVPRLRFARCVVLRESRLEPAAPLPKLAAPAPGVARGCGCPAIRSGGSSRSVPATDADKTGART